MKTVLFSLIVMLVVVVVMVFSIGGYIMSVNNQEVSLRNLYNAQTKVNETTFDTMWKTVQQQTNVADSERDSFRKAFVEIMNSKQGLVGNGSLASFLTEAQVSITPQLYQQLMNTIESKRDSFNNAQKKLIDVKREHDNIRTTFPASLIVGSRPELELKIITSDKTEEVFKNGKDNL